jgi:hypothetical protein
LSKSDYISGLSRTSHIISGSLRQRIWDLSALQTRSENLSI